ncbi:MAG: bifunctional metallophosphatase/5'-nucleotidase [Erysipelotrichaceae bacterium]|nr:bifunctional metallophosphatase/5'-nucleotidase [Erysipelotrichaceae bacterium]MDY6034133.1 bifunctional UDP-sugar hydrolase/5'-nucleotidase [Bulleidia sp.]
MSDRIRILATSDVHGYIYPYSYADHSKKDIGLAKIKSLVNILRDENTLVLDNGDMLEGSPLMYHHFSTTPDEISPITKAMADLKYDYINVGNHDFNYGEEALMTHIQNVGAPCITSNFHYHGAPFGPNYVIRKVAGKKIAIFGLVTQYIPHWEQKSHIKHMRFIDAYLTAEATVKLLKRLENPDYIICMYHGGFERDLVNGRLTEEDTGENEGYRILKNIRGIDVMISGHQHRTEAGKLYDTYYTQTAANGAELACIDIFPDNNTIEPRILKADIDPDEDMMSLLQKEEDTCQTWLDTTLGTSQVDMRVSDEFDARLHKSQVITFLNKVQMEKTGADLSANALFLGATGFASNITMRDLVSTYVYPNTTVVKKITGKILKEYLEKTAEFWMIRNENIIVNPSYDWPKPQHYNYDMVDGISYTIKVSNSVGSRITSLQYQGQDVTDDMEFTIAMNNYRAAGGGNYNMIKEAPVVSTDLSSMVELLANYIQEHKVIQFEPVNNITVIK